MGAFFHNLTPEIKVTVAENSERYSMTPTYIHKLNLGLIYHMLLTLYYVLLAVGEFSCR